MAEKKKAKRILLKQRAMRRVLVALLPCVAGGAGGGFLFGAFFMATDPVSSPRTELARVIYAIIIGACTVVIRNFSIFNGV